ncbi:phospholipase/carboxylesterase family protein [Rhodotorula toruloides]|uniref:Phospholipase/carboxylesterase family protein n=1 Tax=Rhodotorula toruloides TaxID=5286 RepID=A0A511KPU0_RHOTO|nr:phospholipase/carboxylesterase family protein [Rhodotorula toruloides]
MAQIELILKQTATTTTHPKPDFAKVDLTLRGDYSPSKDGVDANLLILFHGLGDTAKPFAQLGRSLHLPQTAVLSLQAPERIPLLEEEAYQWWDSFDPLGELILNPNPSKTLTLLLALLDHLIAPLPSSSSSQTGCGWHPSQIHFFGFAQGGSCAAELALLHSRSSDPSSHLASLVAVSAPLLSHPTLAPDKRSNTKVCLVYRRAGAEERSVGVASWKKGFEHIKEVRLEGGRGRDGTMPRGMDEWREVMRFWSEVLIRKSALELSGEVYVIADGTAGAKAPAPK